MGVVEEAVAPGLGEARDQLGRAGVSQVVQHVVLTDAGATYLTFVLEAFERLQAGANALTRAGEDRVLTVSMSPNFAAKWLVPRLGAFTTAHPDLELRISASMEHVTFQDGGIDMAIRHGDGDCSQ